MCCFCLFGRVGRVSGLALERKAKMSIDDICGGFPVFNGDLQRLNNCLDFPWFLSAISYVDQVLLRTFFSLTIIPVLLIVAELFVDICC